MSVKKELTIEFKKERICWKAMTETENGHRQQVPPSVDKMISLDHSPLYLQTDHDSILGAYTVYGSYVGK